MRCWFVFVLNFFEFHPFPLHLSKKMKVISSFHYFYNFLLNFHSFTIFVQTKYNELESQSQFVVSPNFK